MKKHIIYFCFSVFIFSVSCSDNGIKTLVNISPSFNNSDITDTVKVWNTWQETLSVYNDDSITYRMSDSSLPFLLHNSILSITPQLEDTGNYDFYIIASDQAQQHDTLNIRLCIIPEFIILNKIKKEVFYSPGGTINCGQSSTISDGPSSYYNEYEYNEFGHYSKVTRFSAYNTSKYVYDYDSLY
jgi:hypothetical protein